MPASKKSSEEIALAAAALKKSPVGELAAIEYTPTLFKKAARGKEIKTLFENDYLPLSFNNLYEPGNSLALEYSTGGADLHKLFTPWYGKSEGMVQGKYHKARVYTLETPTHYLIAQSETGDKGTSWYFGKKSEIDTILERVKVSGVRGLEQHSGYFGLDTTQATPEILELKKQWRQIQEYFIYQQARFCLENPEDKSYGIIGRRSEILSSADVQSLEIFTLAKVSKEAKSLSKIVYKNAEAIAQSAAPAATKKRTL